MKSISVSLGEPVEVAPNLLPTGPGPSVPTLLRALKGQPLSPCSAQGGIVSRLLPATPLPPSTSGKGARAAAIPQQVLSAHLFPVLFTRREWSAYCVHGRKPVLRGCVRGGGRIGWCF